MPEGANGSAWIVDWLSEATLAGLLAYILWSSSRKQWFWAHYVQELHERLAKTEKDRDDWKRMALDLLITQRKLVENEQAATAPPRVANG